MSSIRRSMVKRIDPKKILKNTEEQIRVKVRTYSKSETVRDDVKRIYEVPDFKLPPGRHLYLRLVMPYAEAQLKRDEFTKKIKNSIVSREITIKNLNHTTDLERFRELYNEIFFAAPDPSRELSVDEVKHFPEESTFIAYLGSSMVGFVYLTIDINDAGEAEGAVAGIGVLARYRGKKIGLRLLDQVYNYFDDKNIDTLVCEVYEKNEPSLKMFEGLGMQLKGYMILENNEITETLDEFRD